jgi:hypothetical protein
MVLACATALLASVAALLEISDCTLRVQPDIKFELTLRGGTGCIEWVSERPDISKIVGHKCEGDGELTGNKTCCAGAASVASVHTITPPPGIKTQRWFTFMFHARWQARHHLLRGERGAAGSAERLRVATTMRQELHAHELQLLQLSQAYARAYPYAAANSALRCPGERVSSSYNEKSHRLASGRTAPCALRPSPYTYRTPASNTRSFSPLARAPVVCQGPCCTCPTFAFTSIGCGKPSKLEHAPLQPSFLSPHLILKSASPPSPHAQLFCCMRGQATSRVLVQT